MASTINLVGESWIKRKAKAAEAGDAAAMEQLRNVYYREVKTANQRARALDKKGYNTGALIQYRKNLDGQFLSQSKNLEVEDMVRNLKRAEKFMKAKTSKISGENERMAKVYDSLRKPKRDKRGRIVSSAFIKPPPEGMTKFQQERALSQFFKNKHFEELKKNLGSNIIKEAADAINRGIPVIRLSRLYNEYVRENEGLSAKEKKYDLDILWNTYKSGKMHMGE